MNESPKAKILVADDDIEIRSLIREELSEEGFEVIEARDGINALCELPFHNFDLIITDWKMPVRDGIEILESLKATIPDVPVIFMTAFGTGEVEHYVKRLGARYYLSKPFDTDNLKSIIREALGQTEQVPST